MTEMSGDIFLPLENLNNVDVTKWNPLLCCLCNEKYEDPCILSCFHSFCLKCLRGRVVEKQMTCPLCGGITTLKEDNGVPSPDKLLKFLVDQALAEDKEVCANCDEVCNDMFFCNTCAQPLCLTCRETTHKAKMFAKHEVVLLSNRTKEIQRECSIHQEPFILFSTDRKTMLCINCFRDMEVECRTHCVDMETAYNQGCKKLDTSMQAIRDLQNSVRDAIFLLKALLEEIQTNSKVEKAAINELYTTMLEKVTETKTTLLKEVDKQYSTKEKVFKSELLSLSTVLPTLHTHIVTCTAFCTSANKYEFLDLAYVLMDRLKAIIQLQHPLHPSQGGQICTDFKEQFAKCLEPLLFPYKSKSVLTSISTSTPITLSSSSGSLPSIPLDSTFTIPKVNTRQLYSGGYVQTNGHHYSSQKFIDSKGVFTEHCADFDSKHRDLSKALERMKSRVQELQRDLTVRRCLAKTESVSAFQDEIVALEENLDRHFMITEERQPTLEKYWEDMVQRIGREQELYQAQLQDVLRLKQETGHVKTIVKQLRSFVTSITAVTERIAPKLGQTCRETVHDNHIAALFEEINTMQPDSQHRVDAIRQAQEERETVLTANRANPLDEELIKTKGMLKAPSARREGISRKNSTKRDSKEMKDTQLPVIRDSSANRDVGEVIENELKNHNVDEESVTLQSRSCEDFMKDSVEIKTESDKELKGHLENETKSDKELKGHLESEIENKNKQESDQISEKKRKTEQSILKEAKLDFVPGNLSEMKTLSNCAIGHEGKMPEGAGEGDDIDNSTKAVDDELVKNKGKQKTSGIKKKNGKMSSKKECTEVVET